MNIDNKKIMVSKEDDLLKVRQYIREIASELDFDILATTRLVTAASELTRNIIDYSNGGSVSSVTVNSSSRVGIKLIFEDDGPGIKDVNKALQDGFSSGKGLGMGLGGAKRLVDDFNIESSYGKGTRIEIIKWK